MTSPNYLIENGKNTIQNHLRRTIQSTDDYKSEPMCSREKTTIFNPHLFFSRNNNNNEETIANKKYIHKKKTFRIN